MKIYDHIDGAWVVPPSGVRLPTENPYSGEVWIALETSVVNLFIIRQAKGPGRVLC